MCMGQTEGKAQGEEPAEQTSSLATCLQEVKAISCDTQTIQSGTSKTPLALMHSIKVRIGVSRWRETRSESAAI